ncbi:MAG: conserved hypothetical protein [Methanobrevibacter sp. CfCl-M3]
MKCEHCDDTINCSEFFRIGFSNKDIKTEEFFSDFCSESCCHEFIKNRKLNKYKIYKVSRCSGYKYCYILNNLRNMCEREEVIEDMLSRVDKSFLGIYNIELPNIPVEWCEPSQVSIIRSNVKLLESLEEFDKKSSKLNEKTLELNENMHKISENTLKHTKLMTFLTIIMLIVSIINLIFIFKK